MNQRTVFLLSQGWTLLVRDDEDGLWRAPQGGIVRAKEAEETALHAMTVGFAFWLKSLDNAEGIAKTVASLIRAQLAAMMIAEVGEMWADPKFQQQIAGVLCRPESLGPLRDFLRIVLAMPDEPKKDVVLQ